MAPIFWLLLPSYLLARYKFQVQFFVGSLSLHLLVELSAYSHRLKTPAQSSPRVAEYRKSVLMSLIVFNVTVLVKVIVVETIAIQDTRLLW